VSFASPWLLLTLLVVPLAVAGYVWTQRRRTRDAARFVSPALMPNIVQHVPSWRRHLPAALLLLAVTAFLFGFARPHAKLSVRSDLATVVIAVDTSRSMGATDARPTRLRVAQQTAHAFVAGLPSKYRISVVAFSSRAQLVAAPTADHAYVNAAIDDLRLGQGTALGDGIQAAVQVATNTPPGTVKPKRPAKNAPPAAILVLSDGAQDGGATPVATAIKNARTARIPVFSGLIGTANGVVQVPLVGGYVQRIRVPPNAGLLHKASTGTGGKFWLSPTVPQLAAVYSDLHTRLGHERKDEEITVGFAALGVVLLLGGCALSLLWFRRVP
jgi:Ca-activated chloride channel family protein